jgi:1-acyl-sn-glycerol-3-phosphate acyltransferase
MLWLRSALFAALFYPGTFVFVLGCFVGAALSEQALRSVVLGWTRFHHRLCRGLLGIDSRWIGRIPAGPVLIAVKHQSMYETLEMVRCADHPVIVIKQELSDIPLFGWTTRRWGVIPVERSAGAKALKSLVVSGRKAVESGRPVLIFPEGTRVPVGEAPPLKSGFAALYRALGLPVVPVAVDSGRLWGRGLVHRPGAISFMVGETIPAGLDRAEIEARVHAALNALEPNP